MYEKVEKQIMKKRAIGNLSTNKNAKTIQPVSFINSINKIGNISLHKYCQPNLFQRKTDVKEEKDDATDGETKSKKIATPTQGEKWFKFEKQGDFIDSFSDNIYSGVINKGADPVLNTVEIGAQADKEGNFSKDDLGYKSRPVHFGLGDRKIGINSSNRKGRLTWHHQKDQYYMELVDMYVHGGFGHYGGYAAWKDDIIDDDNVD
jgi:hypothetical protein